MSARQVCSILFVDDEPALLAGLRRNLGRRYQVTLARGGEEALAALRLDPTIDIVVTDMCMPKMDGVGLIERMRLEAPQVACLIFTGQIPHRGALSPGALAGVPILLKPCSVDELVAAIDQAVSERRMRSS